MSPLLYQLSYTAKPNFVRADPFDQTGADIQYRQ
jgi:hypothetical protein